MSESEILAALDYCIEQMAIFNKGLDAIEASYQATKEEMK